MASINQIARERRSALAALLKVMHPVDQTSRRVLAQIRSLKARKDKIPEAAELEKIVTTIVQLDGYVNNAVAATKDVVLIFNA